VSKPLSWLSWLPWTYRRRDHNKVVYPSEISTLLRWVNHKFWVSCLCRHRTRLNTLQLLQVVTELCWQYLKVTVADGDDVLVSRPVMIQRNFCSAAELSYCMWLMIWCHVCYVLLSVFTVGGEGFWSSAVPTAVHQRSMWHAVMLSALSLKLQCRRRRRLPSQWRVHGTSCSLMCRWVLTNMITCLTWASAAVV